MSTLTLTKPKATEQERERVYAAPQELGDVLLDAGIVTLSCLMFLGLCLYQLQLPGLYNDEAFDVVPAMQLLLGHHVELQRNIGLHLFGLDLPLMSSSDYQGVTSTYMVLPFFALGGINVISLRTMTVTVGMVGVILTFFLARAWFGRGVARLAVVMIAVSPAWIFWSRLGVYVVSQVMPIAAGALLAFAAWLRRRPLGRHSATLYLGMFLLGLGLTTKLLFLWFIVAAVLTAVIVSGRTVWEAHKVWLGNRALWLKTAFVGAFWFAVGAGPFLVYNVLSGGTFNLLRHTVSAPGTTTNGVTNSALLRNLWTEADAFRVVLDGSYFWFQGQLVTAANGAVARAVYWNPFTPSLFALSALGLVVLIILDHGRPVLLVERRVLPGLAALGAALLVSLVLWTGILTGTKASVLVLIAGASALTGGVMLLRHALRQPSSWVHVSWVLLAVTSVAGALWWFGGSGRAEGPAPGALLGLWPADGAGATFWVSGACLVVHLGFDPLPVRYQRAIVAALTLIALIVAQSAVTVSGLWSTHLLVLLPLPQIVIAAFGVLAGGRLFRAVRTRNIIADRHVLGTAFAVVLVAPIIVGDLLVTRSYQRDLAITGGASSFSDAIYSLATYLDTQGGGRRVVALDWGFKRPIQLLTEERVNPDEAFGYEERASAATRQAIADLVKQPGTLFLFHAPDAGPAYDRYGIFAAAAQDAGKQPVLEHTFYERDAVPVYQVYSVR